MLGLEAMVKDEFKLNNYLDKDVRDTHLPGISK
jgi:hypothetical protein